MRSLLRSALLVTATVALGVARIAEAQCQTFAPDFAAVGLDGPVFAQLVHDDGSGPALFVAGDFTHASGLPVERIAKWNGASWEPLGLGFSGPVRALAVYDDGSGAALYAGGNFANADGLPVHGIARWNGSSWTPLAGGVLGQVLSLAVYDEGSGPRLFVGGEFSAAGGVPARFLARWDGTSWSAVSTGFTPLNSAVILALRTFDDGQGGGTKLWIGGSFDTAGGAAHDDVTRWNGTTFESVDVGTTNGVRAFEVFGGALHAGGAGGVRRWNGASWSTVASGYTLVQSLCTHDDGSGPALYIGRNATTSTIVRWNGTTASVALGNGLNGPVRSLAAFDDGSGNGLQLYAGGSFNTSGPLVLNSFARWTGSEWTSESGGQGVGGEIKTMCVFDDNFGGGPTLFAGGAFTFAGTTRTQNLARWNGVRWSTLLTAMDGEVLALQPLDSGLPSARLFIAGRFRTAAGITVNRIMQRVNAQYFALGGGMTGKFSDVYSLAWFDDGSGSKLFAGGDFNFAGGGNANNIARWNGTIWEALGRGVASESGVDFARVQALYGHDDGSGSQLFVAGRFSQAGLGPASNIARWSMAHGWTPVGAGVSGGAAGADVRALCAFDDGGGTKLFVGGSFTTAGGVPASNLATWDGSNWAPVGSGIDGPVNALVVWDDGSGGGPALYAAGQFTNAGGTAANNIARFDGATWTALGTGLDNGANALHVYDDGAAGGADLYTAGSFLRAGPNSSGRIARWNDCGP